MHFTLSHRLELSDCIVPTHNGPRGTNCVSIFCIGRTLLDSDTPAHNELVAQINNFPTEIFVAKRSFKGVLIIFLPQILHFLTEINVARRSFTGDKPIQFTSRIFMTVKAL